MSPSRGLERPRWGGSRGSVRIGSETLSKSHNQCHRPFSSAGKKLELPARPIYTRPPLPFPPNPSSVALAKTILIRDPLWPCFFPLSPLRSSLINRLQSPSSPNKTKPPSASTSCFSHPCTSPLPPLVRLLYLCSLGSEPTPGSHPDVHAEMAPPPEAIPGLLSNLRKVYFLCLLL